MEKATSSVIWISKSFQWSIRNFSDVCGLGVKEASEIPSSSITSTKEYQCLLDIDSILSPVFCIGIAEDGTLCRWIAKLVKSSEGKIDAIDVHLELTQSDHETESERLLPYECFFKYEIHVLGQKERPIYSRVNDSIVFMKSEKSRIERDFFTLEYLREHSSDLLDDDTLTFRINIHVLSDLSHSKSTDFPGAIPNCGSVTEHLCSDRKKRKVTFSSNQWTQLIQSSQQNSAQILLSSMWKSGANFDATIECHSVQYKVHKAIISEASPVFGAAFTQEMTEKATSKMVISDINPQTFSLLLRFIYSDVSGNEPEWDSLDTLTDLLNAAEKYQILSLKSLCFTKFCQSLTVNNAAKICVLVYLFQPEDQSVQKFIHDFILKNISFVRMTEGFKKNISEFPQAFTPLIMLIEETSGTQNKP